MLNAIFDLLPRKTADLGVKLQGVNGFTGRGEVAFTAWRKGARALRVTLHGVAGRSAEIYADDVLAVTVAVNHGRADHNFDTRRGATAPSLIQGVHIEVRQNGEAILNGILISS